MFSKIIVAVDGSQEASYALDVACDVAQKYGSELHLVHSPQLETTAIGIGYSAVVIEATAKQVAEAGQKVMDEAAKQATDNGCKPAGTVVGSNDPAREILKQVEKTGADLVVMGRRGLGRVNSLLLGSVSQKVSHDATCSCMTVARKM